MGWSLALTCRLPESFRIEGLAESRGLAYLTA
jgi:hypothetical protein